MTATKAINMPYKTCKN